MYKISFFFFLKCIWQLSLFMLNMLNRCIFLHTTNLILIISLFYNSNHDLHKVTHFYKTGINCLHLMQLSNRDQFTLYIKMIINDLKDYVSRKWIYSNSKAFNLKHIPHQMSGLLWRLWAGQDCLWFYQHLMSQCTTHHGCCSET